MNIAYIVNTDIQLIHNRRHQKMDIGPLWVIQTSKVYTTHIQSLDPQELFCSFLKRDFKVWN